MNIKLFKPFPYQQQVIDNLISHWTDSIHILKSRRQIGKSILDANLLIYCSLKHPNQTSIMLSPTLAQARKVYKDICKWMKDSNTIKVNNNMLLEIEFVNGSQIMFKSAEQREALRGYTVSANGLLIIDEAAYITDDIISACLPFVDANHAPVILTSTPRWKEGFFYKFYIQGMDPRSENVFSVDVNEYDTSMLLSNEKLNLYRSQLPSQIFRSDYLGQFLENESDVFGEFEDVLSNSYDYDDKSLYVGIDWGSGNNGDYTAVSIFNSQRQQVSIQYWNNMSPTDTVHKIGNIIEKFRPKRVTVEKNSIGAVYGDMLKNLIYNKGIHTEFRYFITTNDSKRRIIENLAADIQSKTLTLQNDPEMKIELAAYQIEKTRSNGITYNAASGYHDDLIMSTAICLDSISSGAQYNIR